MKLIQGMGLLIKGKELKKAVKEFKTEQIQQAAARVAAEQRNTAARTPQVSGVDMIGPTESVGEVSTAPTPVGTTPAVSTTPAAFAALQTPAVGADGLTAFQRRQLEQEDRRLKIQEDLVSALLASNTSNQALAESAKLQSETNLEQSKTIERLTTPTTSSRSGTPTKETSTKKMPGTSKKGYRVVNKETGATGILNGGGWITLDKGGKVRNNNVVWEKTG